MKWLALSSHFLECETIHKTAGGPAVCHRPGRRLARRKCIIESLVHFAWAGFKLGFHEWPKRAASIAARNVPQD